MSGQLKYILDESACLTNRQLKDYTIGVMMQEEMHAAEHHISSCPLCNDAVDGMLLYPNETVAILETLNGKFIKEHFAQHTPQIHLNSLAPATPIHTTSPAFGKNKKVAKSGKSKWYKLPLLVGGLIALAYVCYEKYGFFLSMKQTH